MLQHITARIKKIIYRDIPVRAFVVTRIRKMDIREKVILNAGKIKLDITDRQGMICLDPFSVAIWLSPAETEFPAMKQVNIRFEKNNKTVSRVWLSLTEKIERGNMVLLIYRAIRTRCYQLNPFTRLLTLGWFLRNKTSTYRERKCIAALYAYPRKVIIVSYKEDDYYNIFPMDIQGYIPESGLYILGLRNTNFTLGKILTSRKLVVGDPGEADIQTIYSLGRHYSASPPALKTLPFPILNTEKYGFPLPGFCSAYYELEIIDNRNLGYHMLLIGKIINQKLLTENASGLYHLHLFQFPGSGYPMVPYEPYQ